MKSRNIKRRGLVPAVIAVLLCTLQFSSCKNLDAATAAAKQLQDTSQQLAAFYHDLSQQIDDTDALTELDTSIPKTAAPSEEEKQFAEQGHKQLAETKAEIDKRAKMAEALTQLAAAYANLAGSTAPASASAAAGNLATACLQINEVKALGNLGPLPAALQSATSLLVQALQEKKLRKSAASIEQVVVQVSNLFDHEMRGYESINNNRIQYAQTLARQLVKEDMFDYSALLGPALKPFGLDPKVTGNPQPSSMTFTPDFRKLATKQIDQRKAAEEASYKRTTEDLSASLKSTADAMKKIASSK